MSKKEAT